MGFPDFYGRYMDAWIDCMSSLTETHPMASTRLTKGETPLLVMSGFEELSERAPEVARDLHNAFKPSLAYHGGMFKSYIVRAEWDADAEVWVASSDDVPGLVTESETLDALDSKLQTLVPELLEANGCWPSDKIIQVGLLARRFTTISMAKF